MLCDKIHTKEGDKMNIVDNQIKNLVETTNIITNFKEEYIWNLEKKYKN